MVKKPIVEVMEGGAKLAKALNDAGIPVTFGKRSEGNTDLSGVIDLASNNIGTGSIPLLEDIESRIHEELGIPFLTTNEAGTNSLIWDIIEYDYDDDVVKYKDSEIVNTDVLTSGLNGKQATLVSGTNIKTVNNESLLGSGDITITGVDIGTFTDLQTLITSASSGGTIILDKDYKYDSTTDSSLTNGITINKNITIIGNGHIIDGNSTKRAFKISGGYTFNISDLIIQNCYYSSSGGAINLNNGTVNITNVNFVKNSIGGGYGGVIRVDSGTLNINDSIFIKNNGANGGAINAISGGNININNSYFIANSASRAGAIHINGATFVMENSVFLANSASSYADIDCNSSTTVKNCVIPNIATSCHNVTNKLYLTDHQSLSSKQDLLVSGTNIATINNQSLLNGGNITIQGGGVEVGTFTDLETLITSASSGSILILDKDYKYDNTTDSSLVNGINIVDNITIIGNGHIIDGNNTARAFYIYNNSTVNLYDLRIQNCYNSVGDGGAIEIDDATVNINNTQFTNNTTTYRGGAIDVENGAIININNATFNQNTSREGGAIYTDDVTVNINNTQFINNTTTGTNDIGGAIYTSDALNMINCSFKDNTASSYGDIYSYDAVTVYNCIIHNITTSCHNVTNITTELVADMIGDAIAYINQ